MKCLAVDSQVKGNLVILTDKVTKGIDIIDDLKQFERN